MTQLRRSEGISEADQAGDVKGVAPVPDTGATSGSVAPAAGGVGIFVNGRPGRTAAPDLAAWVAEEGLVAERVATALNGGFVARERRAQTPVREGDRIDVFQAIVGG